jgi:hypothetical protein
MRKTYLKKMKIKFLFLKRISQRESLWMVLLKNGMFVGIDIFYPDYVYDLIFFFTDVNFLAWVIQKSIYIKPTSKCHTKSTGMWLSGNFYSENLFKIDSLFQNYGIWKAPS